MEKATLQRGFTIVELMITLAVVAILASVAAHSFSTMIQDNRLVAQINELQGSLAYARSEEIKLNNNVTLCSSNNGTACNGNWEDGWIAFVDTDLDGNIDGENIFYVHGTISGDNTLRYTANRLSYLNSGFLSNEVNSTFRLCDDRGAQSARGINISRIGRPALAIDDDGNGIIEDNDGGDITCP